MISVPALLLALLTALAICCAEDVDCLTFMLLFMFIGRVVEGFGVGVFGTTGAPNPGIPMLEGCSGAMFVLAPVSGFLVVLGTLPGCAALPGIEIIAPTAPNAASALIAVVAAVAEVATAVFEAATAVLEATMPAFIAASPPATTL